MHRIQPSWGNLELPVACVFVALNDQRTEYLGNAVIKLGQVWEDSADLRASYFALHLLVIEQSVEEQDRRNKAAIVSDLTADL